MNEFEETTVPRTAMVPIPLDGIITADLLRDLLLDPGIPGTAQLSRRAADPRNGHPEMVGFRWEILP